MNLDNPFALVILGLVTVTVGVLLARHFFSAEARLERRRRRSNTRVASTVRRPMVKFTVSTKEASRKDGAPR